MISVLLGLLARIVVIAGVRLVLLICIMSYNRELLASVGADSEFI
jgi:hypothetical protein